MRNSRVDADYGWLKNKTTTTRNGMASRRASSATPSEKKDSLRIFALEQQVAKLQQESEAAQAFRSEARAALEGLRNAVGALKVEQKFASQRADSAIAELRSDWSQQVSSQRGELSTVTQQVLEVRPMVAALSTKLEALQRTQQEQSDALRSLSTVEKVETLALQITELERAASERDRLVDGQRDGLAAAAKEHAALASSTAATNAAHVRYLDGLRSSLETHTLALQQLSSQAAALHATERSVAAELDSLKKASGRAEMLLQRMGEVHSGRCVELRSLIESTADQLAPLQADNSRHATQIDELTAGITVLAELLHFTNRARSSTFASASAGGVGEEATRGPSKPPRPPESAAPDATAMSDADAADALRTAGTAANAGAARMARAPRRTPSRGHSC